MRLSELRKACRGSKALHFRDGVVRSITCDSRTVEKGSLFVAIDGTAADGHRFLPEAVRRGASAVVAERKVSLSKRVPTLIVPDSRLALAQISARFYGNPASKLRMVGVTGTNGKTTTSFLVRSIFEAAGIPTGMLGTIRYDIAGRLLPATTTTPDPISLMEYLNTMVHERLRVAVMEVSSHALSQSRVAGVRFETAIFTNLTGDHLDYHGDMGSYREAKGRLFRDLGEEQVAVLNEDDRATEYFKHVTKGRVVGYGLRGRGEVCGMILDMNLGGTRFAIKSPWGEAEVHSPLIGQHNVYNSLAAAATGLAHGLRMESVVEGLERAPAIPGRQEIVSGNHPITVMVDYAHTDDALASVLRNVRSLIQGRLILVFGCGGDRDRQKRPLMGAVAERFADYAWITSDNPRREDPGSIIEEIVKGIKGKSRVRTEVDRAIAIRQAIAMARVGDLVLICGKGHETTQTLKDTVIPFDDRIVAREVLKGLKKSASRNGSGRRNGASTGKSMSALRGVCR